MYMIRTTKEKHDFFGETILRPLLSREVVTMFSADPNASPKSNKNENSLPQQIKYYGSSNSA